MKKIVIIGNSPAAVKAIEQIRLVDQESLISIYSHEGALPYNRFLFPELLSGAIKEADVLCQAEAHYKKLNVQLVPDRKTIRLSLKKGRIVFEDKKEEKDEVNYDVLIIAGAATKVPDIKGDHREGIYGLRRLVEVQEVIKNLSLAETIVVQSESLLGLKIVEALRKKGKEVVWLYPQKSFFAGTIEEQTAVSLRQHLESQGIRLLEDNAIAEVLGDTDAKAVRLKSGKVLAAEMIIFSDSGPDIKVYTESGLAVTERLTVNQNFQTSFENVFAVDEICDFPPAYSSLPVAASLALLDEEGKAIAGAITGQPFTFSLPSTQDPALTEIEKKFAAGIAQTPVTLSESSS